MQTFGWYLRRLRGMAPGEIAWRLGSVTRDAADRARLSLGLPLGPRAGATSELPGEGAFRASQVPVGAWAKAPTGSPEGRFWECLRPRADAAAAHRLSFFSLRELPLGDPIAWNRDHEVGRATPMGFAPAIDYRDHAEAGDAKVVWEPSRHQHLVVLARAYRASGDPRYARAVVEQLDSWLVQCPFLRGMQWRSPLELAIRLINWVFAVDLIREADVVSDAFRPRLLHAVHRHVWEVARKYSRGSSANNHLIGEAAGVFVACSYFSTLPGAARWRAEARAILLREIERQTYPEGCNRELALGYHVFALQFFVVVGLVARWTGDPLTPAYWSVLERMMDFLAAFGAGGDRLPLFGDADDGYVVDLGEGAHDWRGWLAAGAVLFGRADLKQVAGGYSEAAAWLLGGEGRAVFDGLEAAEAPLASQAFAGSGHYLLQHGAGKDRVSVLFDCGELGFGSIAAHGHADALSVVVRAFGRDVLVDPGTYDYFRYPAWRRYFRGTSSHNTVEIDGQSQSEMQGLFLWGARARARCVAWEPGAAGGRVVGEHDGYRRLADPVLHRRTLELDGPRRSLVIRDEIEATGSHAVAIHFHFSEEWELLARDGSRLVLGAGGARVTLDVDPALAPEEIRGREDPIGGWVSRGYHVRTPALSVACRASVRGRGEYACRLQL